jgi:energy-coupling factor transporter ATP-binding protein EcfA2
MPFSTCLIESDTLFAKAATAADRRRRVKKVLTLLDLTECRNVIIGSPLEKGISGGQRKRTSVGVVLVNRPSLLFLDEPTSGLDSVTALSLLRTLRGLAHKEHVTIVTTIHQPSSDIFRLFDDLLLLEHGRVMYHGPADEANEYFGQAGLPCPARMNPAEWFLEVISSPEGRDKIMAIPDKPKKDEVDFAVGRRVFEEGDAADEEEVDAEGQMAAAAVTATLGWWRQFSLLFVRSLRLSAREKLLLLIQAAQTIVMGFLIGGVYYQLPVTQAAISLRRACLFFCVINQGVFGAMMTINVFPAERLVIRRELMAGMYPVSAYFAAKNAAEVVLQICFPVLFSVIVYWMVGLQATAGQFFIFLGFMELGMFAANSVALLISVASGTVVLAAAVLPVAIEIARLFGGYFMPPISLPLYFSWITAVSYCVYVYMGLMLNEFSGLVIGGCTPGQSCMDGDQVLSSLGIGYVPLYANALVLIGLIVVLRILAFVVLRWRSK